MQEHHVKTAGVVRGGPAVVRQLPDYGEASSGRQNIQRSTINAQVSAEDYLRRARTKSLSNLG